MEYDLGSYRFEHLAHLSSVVHLPGCLDRPHDILIDMSVGGCLNRGVAHGSLILYCRDSATPRTGMRLKIPSWA